MRPEAHRRSKQSNKRKKTTILRPSLKTGKRNSHRQTNKIEANKTDRTIACRTTIGATINNNGGRVQITTRVQATTLTETKLRASSAGNWATDRRTAGNKSTPTNTVWIQAVKLSGLKLTLQKMVHQSRLSRTRIFNFELDGTHTSSS
jgi:hypothetical protein